MVAILPFATAAVSSILALSSVTNMLQTVRFVNGQSQKEVSTPIVGGENNNRIIQRLEQLDRIELLQVFRNQCKAPESFKDLSGEWEGILLDNNGVIMSGVSSFITHRIFGNGKRWMGKSFSAESSTGENRFLGKGDQKNIISRKHAFDCVIQDSRVLGDESSSSMLLDYNPYQGRLSLWKTMVDELRILDITVYDDDNSEMDVMIGLGWMGWSGGRWNCAPFCLYRRKGYGKGQDGAGQ